MRTLSRPMFKMGGPIKEGVMHGIREPRPGYKLGDTVKGRIGGVKQSFKNIFRAPPVKSVTRLPVPYKPPIEGRIAGGIWNAIKNLYGKLPQHGLFTKYGAIGRNFPVATAMGTTAALPLAAVGLTHAVQKSLPEQLTGEGGLFETSPAAWGGMGAGAGIDPTVDEILRGKKVTEGPYGENLKKEIEKNITIKDDKSSDLPSVEKVLTDAEKKLIEEANLKKAKADKDKRVNELLEIMGYDRSKNDAVSKALIDASQIIGERGTLSKKNITRELINPIIAATGKRLEKPEQIREAVGLMMAKGEIEKDIFKSKRTASEQAIDALAAASGKSAKYIANAKLGIANSPAEAKAQLAKLKNTRITSDNLTAVIQQYADENNIPFKKQITTDQKNEVVGKGKKYASIVDMITDMKLDVDGADDGLYVVGTSIIEVTGGLPKLKG